MKYLLGLAGILAVACAIGLRVSTVAANGVPQLVKLTYLDGISNTGSRDAEGVLEFSFAEAYAKVTADGLEPLAKGQSYQGWLTKSGGSESLNIGVLEIEPTGLARLDAELPVISDYSYDFFLITLEAGEGKAAEPSDSKTIGGFFSIIMPQPSATASTDTRPDRPVSEPSKPTTLPATGTIDTDGAVLRSALLLVLIFASISLSIHWGRRVRRGNDG
jgi:hypothetical protein